MILSNDIYLI